MVAAREGYLEATALKLLEEGCPLLAPFTRDGGRSPLMMAAYAGRLELASSIALAMGDALDVAEVRELMAMRRETDSEASADGAAAVAPLNSPKWYRAWRAGEGAVPGLSIEALIVTAVGAARGLNERERGELLEIAVHDGMGQVVQALVKRGATVDGRALHKVLPYMDL